jgi:hypothetical protein
MRSEAESRTSKGGVADLRVLLIVVVLTNHSDARAGCGSPGRPRAASEAGWSVTEPGADPGLVGARIQQPFSYGYLKVLALWYSDDSIFIVSRQGNRIFSSQALIVMYGLNAMYQAYSGSREKMKLPYIRS